MSILWSLTSIAGVVTLLFIAIVAALVVYIWRKQRQHGASQNVPPMFPSTGLGTATMLLPPPSASTNDDGAGGVGDLSEVQNVDTSSSKGKGRAVSVENFCSIPTCVRCHNYRELSNQIDTRLAQLPNSSKLERLTTTLRLGLPRYHKSYEGATDDGAYQQPTILHLPGLDSSPLPDIRKFPWTEQFFGPDTLEALTLEFYSIANSQDGWAVNNTPSGNWAAFHLFNQGRKNDANCAACPYTASLIEKIPEFMNGCVFGNAFFSIVSPGTHITPHCGPTNTRLRTHVTLFAPNDICLNVATHTTQWQQGVFVFDDSYAHEVVHFGEAASGDRVVLIIDCWHPDVTIEEQGAIRQVFSLADE